MLRKRPRSALIYAAVTLVLLWNVRSLRGSILGDARPKLVQSFPSAHLLCRGLPGANETLIIFRTSSTELEDRFAIHLNTSIRCMPNYLIFSDHEEHFHQERILDALADVDPEISQYNPDFELYRRLRHSGRAALDTAELAGPPDRFANLRGKQDIPGWKLDKWKFLPMVNRTLFKRPNMKWYVFIESDSFLMWSMLLQYLEKLDPAKPVYAGSQTYISNVLFAHGGSGFIVSQPALRMVVDHYTANKAAIESFTDEHWAGDCVLGKAFTDSGVPFTNVWPALQSDYPAQIPYSGVHVSSVSNETSRLWCYPTISYHHMSPVMISNLWHLEQQWLSRTVLVSIGLWKTGNVEVLTVAQQSTTILRHRDIFTHYVLPQMMSPREDWDNMSDVEVGNATSSDQCRARCVLEQECRQYSLGKDGTCRIRVDLRLGTAEKGVSSGWIKHRIREFQRNMAPCGSEP